MESWRNTSLFLDSRNGGPTIPLTLHAVKSRHGELHTIRCIKAIYDTVYNDFMSEDGKTVSVRIITNPFVDGHSHFNFRILEFFHGHSHLNFRILNE